MFKPDSKFKKMCQDYRNTCYIHRDGISMLERRQVKSGQFKSEIEVWHIYPCKISIRVYEDGTFGESKNASVNRIVVHNPEELLSGIEGIEIYLNSGSENSKKAGILTTGITVKAANGTRWSRNVIPQISDNFTIQPLLHSFSSGATVPSSCHDYGNEYGENKEVHEQKEK